MTLRRDPGADRRLYLEDLEVGQRFVSRSHAIDKEQIKAFAAQFDPQAFHLDAVGQGRQDLAMCSRWRVRYSK